MTLAFLTSNCFEYMTRLVRHCRSSFCSAHRANWSHIELCRRCFERRPAPGLSCVQLNHNTVFFVVEALWSHDTNRAPSVMTYACYRRNFPVTDVSDAVHVMAVVVGGGLWVSRLIHEFIITPSVLYTWRFRSNCHPFDFSPLLPVFVGCLFGWNRATPSTFVCLNHGIFLIEGFLNMNTSTTVPRSLWWSNPTTPTLDLPPRHAECGRDSASLWSHCVVIDCVRRGSNWSSICQLFVIQWRKHAVEKLRKDFIKYCEGYTATKSKPQRSLRFYSRGSDRVVVKTWSVCDPHRLIVLSAQYSIVQYSL